MAETTSAAVSALLGLIRNEAALPEGVGNDVEFIKEEMESLNSFLLHLARTVPDGGAGAHDEQVRAWMKQIRDVASTCTDCIDRYLYSSNPDNHLARRGIRRCLEWLPWQIRKLVARHRAAIQLRELKYRVRDVSERRLRYGVVLPPVPLVAAAGAAEDDAGRTKASPADPESSAGDGDGGGSGTTAATRRRVVHDYFNKRLVEWISKTRQHPPPTIKPSIQFVLPDDGTADQDDDAGALPRHALAMAQAHFSRRCVLVDVPAVHWDPLPLRRKEILFYILREIRLASQSQEESRQDSDDGGGSWSTTKWGIYHEKKSLLRSVKNIKEMQVDEVFAEVDSVIRKGESDNPLMLNLDKTEKEMKQEIAKQPLDVLLRLLIRSTAAADAQRDQPSKKAMLAISVLYDDTIKTTAKKLQELMEAKAGSSKQPVPHIRLQSKEYEDILKEVFPIKASTTNTTSTTNTSTTNTLAVDQVREMPYKVLQELQEDGSAKNREGAEHNRIREAAFTVASMKQIKKNIREQLKIKWIMHEIQNRLMGESILIIFKTDHKFVSITEENRNILGLLGISECFAGAAIMTTATTEIVRQAKKYFCCPQLEPIEYSRVGRYLGTVLQYTRQHTHEDSYHLLRSILEECVTDEFCMRIFAHALKAKPKRSLEELLKLHSTLQTTPKTLIRTKMLEFSYSDLPREHRLCLLHLSIFPADSKPPIRRSTLIGRWVVEGLANTEDWTWSSSVAEAEKCFDALIDRCLVSPVDISATGKVKSCTVDGTVHQFITKMIMKQRTVGGMQRTFHLARYFSFFNDIHLRSSDSIETFLHKIPKLSHFHKLKVLDLEDCRYVTKNQRCLKHICCKMLMLRYLSLRRTDVTQLPHEINNLHELEVLDIRQTNIPVSSTTNILLPKLKRLLAGHTDTSPSNTGASMAEDFSCVHIPKGIKEMKDVEVMSYVKPMVQGDLLGIGGLARLKKLGVVINKNSHLKDLLQVLGTDLGRGLQFLSMILDKTRNEGSLHDENLPGLKLEALESLSISGSTRMGLFHPLLACESLAKVTLSRTSVNQDDLKVLANLPKLRCLRLQDMACTNMLSFNKDEFPKLNILVVNSSDITKISFNKGPPELEKIVWSFTNIESLSSIGNLPRLKDLELIGGNIPNKVQQDISSILGLYYKHKEYKNQDQATGIAQEEVLQVGHSS